MFVLGLDLGTTTGISIIDGSKSTQVSRSVLLAKSAELRNQNRATEDIRFERLRQKVVESLAGVTGKIVVAWEDVQFCSSTYQFQLWCTLRAAVWAALDDGRTFCRMSVPVGTLKLFATGSGNADKSRMLTTAIKRSLLPVNSTLGDDAVDALWVARWALSKIP